jgi:diguanylate cyclase
MTATPALPRPPKHARTLATCGWTTAIALILLLCMGGFIPAQAATAAPLLLEDQTPRINAWPAVTLQDDPQNLLSVDQLLARTDGWHRPSGDSTLGMRQDPVWLRLPIAVSAASDGRWVLMIDYPSLQHIDVYLTQADQVVQSARLGSRVPKAQRALPILSHAVSLHLEPGQAYEILLRVQTNNALVLPIHLRKPAAMLAHALDEQMLQGLLIGLALCLILYSLAQWVSVREPLFIQYALMTSGSLLFILHFHGIGSQYLWPDQPWLEQHAGGLASFIATTGSFLFIGQVLAGHLPRSRWLLAMRGGALLSAVLLVVYALGTIDNRAVAAIITVLGLLPVLMGMPGAWRAARRGDPVGTTLLLAWVVYFLATATAIAIIQGWAPVNAWTLHAFQFGATLDMVLFLHVLGLRAKAMHLAALHANRERDAMQTLAHTDPLTGLPNRRGLQIALSAALPETRPGKPVAVYLIDLDGFKPVNDTHGHDVGDELLVAVARRLQGHVRQSDVVARLGGDEFVIMARIGTPAQAHELGLKLIDAFRAPFSLGSLQVGIGLTIGYALAPHDSREAVELLKLADAAMYAGKQGGRFCLRRHAEGDIQHPLFAATRLPSEH